MPGIRQPMSDRPAQPLLVALGPEARSLRLIHAGFWAARSEGRPWIVVHVELPGDAGSPEREQARLWLQEAERLGASTLWICARTVAGGLQEAVRQTGADLLLVGRTQGRWPWARLGHGLAQELERRLPAIEVRAKALGPELPPSPWLPPKGRRLGAGIASLMVLGACTAVGALLPEGQPLPAVFLLFLLATAFIAQEWGKAFAVGSILASALVFDLVFDSAPGSLLVGNPLLMALFLAILLIGQLAVSLSERLARQTRAARRREAITTALLLLGGHLANAADVASVADALSAVGERLLGRPLILRTGAEVRSEATGGDPGAPELRLGEGHARLPLAAPGGATGMLEIALAPGARGLSGEEEDLLRAFAVQAALAVERVEALASAREAELARETERLRSALLGAVGHDLRTPLAAIHGAASSLLLDPSALPDPARDLIAMIREESDRLAQLLTNLLDLTRLESGTLEPEREWQSIEELVASALARAEAQAGRMEVNADLPPDLPLVSVDGVLVEQLLLNLLVNAQRHAPSTPVDLRAWRGDEGLELEVADRGPGIPEADRERVFEAFFRPGGRTQDGGVGLGLAICQAIARIHGGRIWVEARPGGGARFRVTLPAVDTPPEGPGAEGMR